MKIENKKKTSVKQVLMISVALILVAIISVTATLAYLSVKKDPVENIFLGSQGIDLEIQEDKFEDEKAEDYAPGSVIAKNPTLVNTSTTDGYEEWVAMKVSFKERVSGDNDSIIKNGLTYAAIKNVINEISFDADEINVISAGNNWIKIEETEEYFIFMYKNVLGTTDEAAGTTGSKVTTELFQKVEIKDKIKDLQGVSDISDEPEKYPAFQIDIEGAAIKNVYYVKDANGNDTATSIKSASDLKTEDLANVKSALIALFN